MEAGGLPMLVIGLFALALSLETLSGKGLVAGAAPVAPGMVGWALLVVAGLCLAGLTPVSPGEARVVQLFGRYAGTTRTPGLRFVNPFARRRSVSVRLRNHETSVAKVNDADGNPIEIAAVVVWQVADSARTLYDVDDFANFVAIQPETAVQHIASQYPYDSRTEGQPSLRDNVTKITGELSTEIAARVAPAGVRIAESRLSRPAFTALTGHYIGRLGDDGDASDSRVLRNLINRDKVVAPVTANRQQSRARFILRSSSASELLS